MIKSMTGFGRGEYSDEQRNITVEIKAVNYRYCDIYVKMPRRYAFAEEAIKSAIKEKLLRGKIEVSIIVDNFSDAETDIRLNEAVADRYYEALRTLAEKYDLGDGDKSSLLAILAGMPEVIKTTPQTDDEEKLIEMLLAATAKALESICQMRETEGAKLVADLRGRADTIEGIKNAIEVRAPEISKEYADKLKVRIQELLGEGVDVPEDRIMFEAAVFADKSNITEELVRLGSHIGQLRTFLNGEEPAIGKKIDFLIQEMNREANTIGSKSNDGEITALMLELKAEIEKIREQVQNIE